jgi:sugar O-acyltransferase (sialic acid O-acetyltransferase NeuD family)
MSKVIVFGNGQFAELADYYLKHDSRHRVVAFTVDDRYCDTDSYRGRPLIAWEEIKDKYPPDDYKLLCFISYRDCNQFRASKYLEGKAKGYEFISYVSSRALTWPDLQVGENCFIFELNNIQPTVKIGNDCVLWAMNHIGHHTVIRDHCFIASHVCISGAVDLGAYSFVGVNACIRDNIKIGESNVIGMGAVVTQPTMDKGVYVGSPAQLKGFSDEVKI